MCVDVFAHYTHCQHISIRTMHQVTAHCCHSNTALPPLLLLLPPQSSASPTPLSYLSERFRLSCAGTPRRSAGSRPGHVGSARGWRWSPGPRWLGYARPQGPGQWWGSPRWPGPPRWLPRLRSAWSLRERGSIGGKEKRAVEIKGKI